MEKIVIGRKDKVDLPFLELKGVPVKIDTGAYTSSIHCTEINEVKRDGVAVLEVQFFDWDEKKSPVLIFEEFKTKKVKSSTGHKENRYVIKGNVRIFNKTSSCVFTLSKRHDMKFPILLGRKLLNKVYVVDPVKTNLSFLNRKTTVFIR
jgi:hypothetical protein